MIPAFTYTGLPSRVLFGDATRTRLLAEAERLGMTRALVLTTPQQSDMGTTVLEQLGSAGVEHFPGATMHTPVAVTRNVLEVVKRSRIDGVVSVGGGSTIGLGKAIAWHTDLPQLVLPTTYAGSEMTPILGQTDKGEKTTLRDLRVLPETVIYDVDMTLSLPAKISGVSGINAIAHAVEALYAEDGNPVISMIAEEGIRALYRALPVIATTPGDRDARSSALYGAWLCAVCLGSTGVALHHKLCHVLGGSFDLPHAPTHAIVLPHALAHNASAIPEAMPALRRALDSETPATALFDLLETVGAHKALHDLGMPESGIEKATSLTLKNPYWNPRPLEEAAIRETLKAAWSGERPDA
jgi:alcohol dehydrogenase class IV